MESMEDLNNNNISYFSYCIQFISVQLSSAHLFFIFISRAYKCKCVNSVSSSISFRISWTIRLAGDDSGDEPAFCDEPRTSLSAG